LKYINLYSAGNAGENPGLPSNREWERNPHKRHWLKLKLGRRGE